MTKQTAIRKFCMDCASTHKDVALCTAPSCALWPWRLGCSPRTSKAKDIMERIRVKYPEDVADLGTYGLDPSVFFPPDTLYKPKKRVGSIFGRPVGGQVAPEQKKD